MSDDLVKRLRNEAIYAAPFRTEQLNKAADRIEALEAKLAEYKMAASVLNSMWVEEFERADAAEAKLAKAVEALEKMNIGEGWAAQIARATLAELTGGKYD